MSNYAQDMAAHERPDGPVRSIIDRGRQINQDAHALVADLQEAADAAQHFIADEMKRKPYTTLAVAAGIGYVLGGGLSSRATGFLISTGARLAIAIAARQLADAPRPSRTTL